MTSEPVGLVLVGLGHRTLGYADYVEQHPDRATVVAVVDPDPVRREAAATRFAVPPERRYALVSDLPDQPLARAAVNGTMDAIHVETSLELLDRGYDLLLEKPIALEPTSMLQLQRRAEDLGRLVVVCHVLRHAPFYAQIKERVAAGQIGTVTSLDMAELVSYSHMATSYVRGRWRSRDECGSSFLMAKSCHDMDLMAWLAAPGRPVRATSTGSLTWFREENAPAGSGSKCLVDCQIEAGCPYSARRIYVELGRHDFYPWESLEHLGVEPTREQKLESLRTDNPFGRCVWRSDNDVADRQAVVVEFDTGAVGTLSLTGTAARGDRTIQIVGTEGEITGSLAEERFEVRRFSADQPRAVVESVSVSAPADAAKYAGHGHGGGDLRLMADFVALLRGGRPTLSTTALADSINGHLAGFAAEQGRLSGRWVELDELRVALD
ncbi:MAG TPA: Gfo/Idh/MocA family oxidoreductase [Candidatus Avipropionibacterium avicola]|uniref:Gfo/Idh/MocA family oxidoreductase n=1 Tax=Candidatus Avipropionibacterium avicola TaxID=2840701 RepID=A0A9D1KPA1_9ACTN|nr:Gfo/Idh/MocA family oxidoreductase [Candidatus Avipropionibacterium avicola]